MRFDWCIRIVVRDARYSGRDCRLGGQGASSGSSVYFIAVAFRIKDHANPTVPFPATAKRFVGADSNDEVVVELESLLPQPVTRPASYNKVHEMTKYTL